MGPTQGKVSLCTMMSRLFAVVLVHLVASFLLQTGQVSTAAIAQSQYYMDNRADCVRVGFVSILRNQVTYVSVFGKSDRSNNLVCTLQFEPQERGDTLRMWIEKNAFIGNCDTSVTLSMTNNRQYVLGCRSSPNAPTLEAVDGKATIKFVRRQLDKYDYFFRIGVQAVKTQDPAGSGDSDTQDVAMIAGIVAAAVVSIVLILVLCVCCYRKRKHDRDFKVQGSDNMYPQAAFENGKMKQDYGMESPSSEKRLLVKSSSDHDPDENSLKPKAALDRFGPTAARRSDRPKLNSERSVDTVTRERNGGRNEYDEDDEQPQRRHDLDDLRKNAKFRRSFHDTEVDANSGVNRISGSAESSVSYNSNGVQLPPQLPPVPRSPQRSPSPQRKGEKIAAIFRARPSSSGSEIARQLEGDLIENGDDSTSEFVPSPRRETKADTRHVLRPNREERQSRPERRRREEEDDNEEERRNRRRERDRKEEEKERLRKQEEEEQREEEEKRRKKKERERRRRQEEEEEEEEERKERKRREKEREREKEDDRLEGRFKKSASGRRSKGKGKSRGRSKSTSNALEEMDANYQRSRSKSPSSVRSLNFIEDDDDDDDLDSSYMPFKRAGSKQSLYASRSSLYGRRRKNSMGETVSLSSYAYDDMDSRYGDFDRKSLSRRDKDKMFKSTGELEMHGATAQVVRECGTQTDSAKAVYIYGRKTLAKSRPGKMYSRGSQTGVGRSRRDSTGSARSSRSRMKKSRSQESLRKQRRSRSRNLDESYDSVDRQSRRSRSRHLDDSFDSDDRSRKSRSRDLDNSDDDDGRRSHKKKHHRSKSRGLDDEDDDDYDRHRNKPRARPRKSTGAASVDLYDSDGGRSAAASSIAASYAHPPPPNPYGAQYVPVMYPPPQGMAYVPGAPGGPPMIPGVTRPGAPAVGPKPPIGPKPKKSKWDELVAITDQEKHRQNQRPDSPTESMATSVFSHPANGAHPGFYHAPPSYNTAQKYPPDPNSTFSSAYPDSSGLPLSGRGPHQYGFGPSESDI